MLGAIIGDIIGSVYEWNNIKTKDFPLFCSDCHFTDDTVMTIATAEALINGGKKEDFIAAYKKWGRMYPDAGYGNAFNNWLNSDGSEPYNSFGNGSAMRVSPCGWIMDRRFFARTGCWPVKAWGTVKCCAEVTHNHPEGIKGAQATAAAVFLGLFYAEGRSFGYSEKWSLDELKRETKNYIENSIGYDLSRSLEEIRPSYTFNETCQDTVPQAITAFLESTDFEDAVRNAISLGGDSDTLAAITGSIAESVYGIPEMIKKEALSYLDKPILDMIYKWEEFLKKR